MAAREAAALLALVMVASACTGNTDTTDTTEARNEASQAEQAETTTQTKGDSSEVSQVAGVSQVADESSTRSTPAQVAIAPQAETAEQLAAPWIILRSAEPGESGPHVQTLQERLSELGIGAGSADGSYGRRTEIAVSAFQDLVALPETGIADSDTVFALAEYRYDGLVLHAGTESDQVRALQERLASGPFDPGPIDGEYGTATVQAVWALEKLAGMPVDGDWGPLDERAWELLQDEAIGQPTQTNTERWVEVDLSEQLAKVFDPGQSTPTLVTHISSGSGVPWENDDHRGNSITPTGEFHIDRRISGWRESSLNIGRLYNPLYFNGGIAFHGASSVPLYPASHGCIRLPMHVAEYIPQELPNGTKVIVRA